MSKVKFTLVKNNPDSETAFIRLSFNYGNPPKRLFYYVGQGILPAHWDKVRQRAITSRANPQHESLNASLDDYQKKVLTIFNTFELSGEILSVERFKKEMDILMGKATRSTDQKLTRQHLFEFIDGFIESRKENPEYARGTICKYRQTLTHLRGYEKYAKKKLDFDSINLDFYERFTKYLYAQNYTNNFVGKMIATLKVFLNEATEKGVNKNMAFKSRKFTVLKEEINNIYLSEREIDMLYQMELSDNLKLDRVRDLFIIGCYTGLRFSDLSTLSAHHITQRDDHELLQVTTQKTSQSVTIPLHPFVKSIIMKYNGNIPKTMSNQKMNDYLKELGQLADLKESVSITKTRGGKRSDTVHEKWELITTHTARRSFATNAFKRGIPSISIMKITGHTTEKSFMKYIKITNEENAILMYSNDFFKGKERGKLRIV
jgi:integrase